MSRAPERTIGQVCTGELMLVEHTTNIDDILASFHERPLPVGDLAADALAREVLAKPPRLGCLTISNARQWRLQYRRAIGVAGDMEGIDAL